LAALLLTSFGTTQAAQDPPDNRSSRVDYVLAADVVPLDRDLTGKATITWTNRTADTVSDLWFHLHLNAYSNNRSTHLWESNGMLRGVKLTEGWGWQRVDSLTVGGTDLMPSLTWQVTPQGREEDRTVFSVDLPEAVQPGAAVTIELTWTSKLPRVRRRTGVKDDFVFLAHWFPKLGVYEGGEGWNCHQFHMNTEFYSNYGTYDVTLTLPKEYAGKIGTSGAPAGEPTIVGDKLTQRFHAPALADLEYTDPVPSVAGSQPVVHGFAWTADPNYHVHETSFEFTAWKDRFPAEVAAAEAAFGLELGSLSLRSVKVRVLIQPERKAQAERHAEATMAALFFYGLWFGEYPYSELTAVDPAWGASGAGGMEYPTLFTCGTSKFTRARMHRPESVTVHEAGHQFWYGLVGNNEYEAAWLDEGFNSYTDSEVLARVYGKRRAATSYAGLPFWGRPTAGEPAAEGIAGILSGRRWKVRGEVFAPLNPSPFVDLWRDQPWLTFGEEQLDPRWGDRSSYLGNPDADPVHTAGFLYRDRSSYRVNSYPRPAVILRTLSGVVGQPTFLKGMRHYASEWRYRHPYPGDFFESFQEGAGVDVSWFFEDLFEGTGVVDWGVDVRQNRASKPKGYFLRNGVFVDITEDDGDEPEGEDEDLLDKSLPWIFDVVVRRHGTLCLPLTIEVTFEDATVVRFEWTREAQLEQTWLRLPLEQGVKKIKRVLIDPERFYYIDANMADNQWYDQRDEVTPVRWAERAWSQYTHLLHWYSTIGG
ncbi:MAG: M1 family metallopeptidase, partial [Planctomycetota bacterium]|nr:M1 family metallopeptidase [Planctomycetota bacterium]